MKSTTISEHGGGGSANGIATISGPQQEDHNSKEKKVSGLAKARRLITVEPLLFLYMMSFQASLPLQQQFVYRKLIEIHTNDSSSYNSMNLTSNGSEGQCGGNIGRAGQQKAQSTAALLAIVFGLATIIPAIFSTILLGSFSDRAGRKWGLIPPFIGDIIKNLICIAIILFDLPFWQLLVVGCFVNGFMGTTMVVLNVCFAYIADVSSVQQRLFRIVVIEVILGLADMTANIAVGNLIAALGFLYSYCFVLAICVINLLYAIFILEETVKRKPGVRLCSFENYTKAFQVYFSSPTPGRRPILLLCVLIFTFFTMVEQGADSGTLDLYFMNAPLCWKSLKLGYYRALITVVRYAFSLFAVRCLVRPLSASGLLLLGCASILLYNLVLAQVKADWIAIIAALSGFSVGLVSAMIRGMASHRVRPEEQGALFSGQGMTILISALAGNIVYNVIYARTVRTYATTVFYVAAGQVLIMMVFAWFLHVLVRRYPLVQTGVDPDMAVVVGQLTKEEEANQGSDQSTRF